MNSFSEKEISDIVQIVQANPCVWDTTHPVYMRKGEKEKVFKYIGGKLERNPDDVKNCWNAVREKYRKELQNEKKMAPRSGAGAPKKYKRQPWPLLEALKFLDKSFRPRKTEEMIPIGQNAVNKQGNVKLSVGASDKFTKHLSGNSVDISSPASLSHTALQSLEASRTTSLHGSGSSPLDSSFPHDELLANVANISSTRHGTGSSLQSFSSPKNVPPSFKSSMRHEEGESARQTSFSVQAESLSGTLSIGHESVLQDNSFLQDSISVGTTFRDNTQNPEQTDTPGTPDLPDNEENFPCSKKRKTLAKTLEDERRAFTEDISNIMRSTALTAQSNESNTGSQQELMAKSFAEYLRIRFLNWNVQEQMQGFKKITEVVDAIDMEIMNR